MKCIIIFGAGKRGRLFKQKLSSPNSKWAKNEMWEVERVFFFDNNTSLQNSEIDDVRVLTLAEFEQLDKDRTKIFITTVRYNEVLSQCATLGFWRIEYITCNLGSFFLDSDAVFGSQNSGDMSGLAWQRFEDTDQWSSTSENTRVIKTYHDLCTMTIEELNIHYPIYLERLQSTVKYARGNVLEVGCGCGNITRWLFDETYLPSGAVKSVVAVDKYQTSLKLMESYPFYDNRKIRLHLADIDRLHFAEDVCFDTIMLSEVVEHVSLYDEISFIENIRPNRSSDCCFIVSTPIGYMSEKYHLRGFSPCDFILHLETYYGTVKHIHFGKLQQVAYGYFAK